MRDACAPQEETARKTWQEGAGFRLSGGPQEDSNPADTLVLTFQPPEHEQIHPRSLKHPVVFCNTSLSRLTPRVSHAGQSFECLTGTQVTWVQWVQRPHSELFPSALRGREGVAEERGMAAGVEEEVTGQECCPGISWAPRGRALPCGREPGNRLTRSEL